MTSELENYHVKKKIGCGQFGKVFEVQDKRDEKTYALKIISFQENPSIKNCLKEAKALAGMETHLNIVRYYHCWIGDKFPDLFSEDDSGILGSEASYDDETDVTMRTVSTGDVNSSQTGGPYYFAGNFLFIKTELCEMNLRTWMNENMGPYCKKKGIKPILDLFVQISVSVKFIHTKGFVHRDLKPENIFVSKYGQSNWKFKIGDFGIVSKTLPQSPTSPVRASKYSYGTIPYAAPEILQGKEFDGRADVYSMAVILLEMLYPMNTATEVANIVEIVRTNKKSDDPSFTTFRGAHPVEVAKLREMLTGTNEGRPTAKEFHIWLKSHRSSNLRKCDCHQ